MKRILATISLPGFWRRTVSVRITGEYGRTRARSASPSTGRASIDAANVTPTLQREIRNWPGPLLSGRLPLPPRVAHVDDWVRGGVVPAAMLTSSAACRSQAAAGG